MTARELPPPEPEPKKRIARTSAHRHTHAMITLRLFAGAPFLGCGGRLFITA